MYLLYCLYLKKMIFNLLQPVHKGVPRRIAKSDVRKSTIPKNRTSNSLLNNALFYREKSCDTELNRKTSLSQKAKGELRVKNCDQLRAILPLGVPPELVMLRTGTVYTEQ